MANLPNVYQTRVRSHQTDLNAAMYHGAFFDAFDDARIETFRRFGYTYADALAGGWAPVVRRTECDYFAAARMDDQLEITVTVPKLTPARMTIRYDCRRDGEVIATGQCVFAFLSAEGKPMRVPEALRRLIQHEPLLSGASTKS